MTGWRIGYMAAPLFISKACDKLQGQVTSGACSVAQRASLTAVMTDPGNSDELKGMVAAFKDRRDYLLEIMKEIPGFKTNIPDGAFYIFADCSYYFGKTDGETTIKDGNDLSLYLLYKAHVAMVAGNAFGDPNCIRLSYAITKDELREAVTRIKKTLDLLH